MSGRQSGDPRWSRRRWLWATAFVFLLQLAFIYALGQKIPPAIRTPPRSTDIASVPESVRLWPASSDPTLFARPQHMGFAGKTWLAFHPPSYDATELVQQLELLPYAVEDAGRAYLSSVASNTSGLFDRVSRPTLHTGTPPAPQTTVTLIHPSVLKLQGELLARPMISKFELPAWRSDELLQPTIVQVTVDGLGRTISAYLFQSSGMRTADERALELAREARFEPVKREGPGRVVDPNEGALWGRMVFDWQTLPSGTGNNKLLITP